MEFFQINDEIIEKTRLYFNTNKTNIERDIKILREWLQKQPHLPQNITDKYLENIYIRNKCRIEVCKQKMENYFVGKNIYGRHFDFTNYDISKNAMAVFPLPILNNGDRICFIKITNPDLKAYNFEQFSKGFEIFSELSIHYDYCQGYQYVWDVEDYTLTHLGMFDIPAFSEMAKMFFKGQSFRVTAIHIFNVPSYFSVFMNILRGIFPAKIFKRVKLYPTLDDFCKEFPKEILPKDYGGNSESIKTLQEKWSAVVYENRNFLEKSKLMKSNEKYRIGESKYIKQIDDLNGTFRKIEID